MALCKVHGDCQIANRPKLTGIHAPPPCPRPANGAQAPCKNRTTPQLKQVRFLSVRTETPEGGVVVRSDANFSEVLIESPEVATGGERTVDLKLDLVKLPFGSQDNWV